MKRAFVALAIAALSSGIGTATALSDEVDTSHARITKESIEVCKLWGEFAELAMNAHQEGKPLADQMQLSPDDRAYEIILDAYRKPRFQYEQMKKAASASYRDQIVAECLVSLSSPDASAVARPHQFWAIEKTAP